MTHQVSQIVISLNLNLDLIIMVELRSRHTPSPNKQQEVNEVVAPPKQFSLGLAFKAATVFAVNFGFGFLLQKGGVYIPQVIQGNICI